MPVYVNIDIDQKYGGLFATRAGYLPEHRASLHPWHKRIEDELRANPAPMHSPSVQRLGVLIESNGIVRMYVEQMLQQQGCLHDPLGNPIPPASVIKSIPDMLDKLAYVTSRAPWYNEPHFPISALFVYTMMTPAGEALFRYTEFNECLRTILREWCNYLESPASRNVLTTSEDPDQTGWLSPAAYRSMKLWLFEILDFGEPHWGFSSYNGYFHRKILSEVTAGQEPPERYPKQRHDWQSNARPGEHPRPIAGPGDSRVVVSANDGTVWKIARNVQREAKFWLKGQPYSLVNMLNGHPNVDEFVGGDVFQSFLSGANYHRWHAPIDGVVKYAKVTNGLMFSDAESAGWDPGAGIKSQGYESAVNTRGLVLIENEAKNQKVWVIPVGITEISSVTISVEENRLVKKGDELGYFSYGGSTLVLVFARNVIREFTTKLNDPIDVNAQIAVAY